MTGRTGIIAACVAVVALGLWLVCGRGVVKEAVQPVENGSMWFSRSVWSRVRGVFRGSSAEAENIRLRQELDLLRMVHADARRVLDENARLRGLLALDAPRGTQVTNGWICAPVLSRDGAAGVRGLVRVGRGSVHGVKVNAAVAVPDGLVGRVEQVSARTADVRLITSPAMKVSCSVETDDPDLGSIQGILEGGGARTVRAEADASLLYVIDPLRIRHLKRRPSLPPRAKIVTNGLGGVFPPGLTVGFLMDGQDVDETSFEREGDVMPAVDFRSLEDVFIRRED